MLPSHINVSLSLPSLKLIGISSSENNKKELRRSRSAIRNMDENVAKDISINTDKRLNSQ